MKRLILLLLLLTGAALTSNAQQKLPTADEIAKKNVDQLEKRLQLTPTQKSIIYNYAYECAKEQVFLFKKQQAGTFQPEDETKFFRLSNDMNRKIKTVLKAEQISEYDKVVEERLSGIDPEKDKKKKKKKGEPEEKVVGIEGLKSVTNN